MQLFSDAGFFVHDTPSPLSSLYPSEIGEIDAVMLDHMEAFPSVSEPMVLYEDLSIQASIDYMSIFVDPYADSLGSPFLTVAPIDLMCSYTSVVHASLLLPTVRDPLPSATLHASCSSSSSSPLSTSTSPLNTPLLECHPINHVPRLSMPTEPSAQPRAPYIQLLSSLEDMMYDWSAAETRCGRRLVRFSVTRYDSGHRMVARRAILPHEYTEEFDLADTFSCIARPSSGFVITSVDLLHLAELLYGDKSSVPEKNRLRRHLEVAPSMRRPSPR